MGLKIKNSKNIVTDQLVFHVDASDKLSYSGSGSTWVDRVNGNNGTLTNGPSIDLADGGSIAFDGTNQHVLTTFTPTADDNKTISVWVNFDAFAASYDYIIGLDHNNTTDSFIPISLVSSGGSGDRVLRMRQVFGTLGTSLTVYTNLVVNTGEWVNLVISSNGSAFSFYKDGVKGTTSGTNNGKWFSVLNEPIMIGASDWTSSQLLRVIDGKIASVSIYNKQLTDSEILQNYNATKRRFGL